MQFLLKLFQFITVWGHVVVIVFILFSIAWRVVRIRRLSFHKRLREGLISLATFSIVGGVATGMVHLLKKIIPTARPFVVAGVDPLIPITTMDSFPSGHAFALFALAGAAWFFSKKLSIVLFVVAFLTVAGRVYFGLHYVVDVVVGGILGLVFGILAWKGIHLLDVYEQALPRMK